MRVTENGQEFSFQLSERTIAQLDELVRIGRFTSRQTAVAVAVEHLLAEEYPSLEPRRAALARVCGSLRLGSTRKSLRNAERDRLDWESGQR
jgi:Arc/MetJ-type ribon-helix-helix transcriptional regulator